MSSSNRLGLRRNDRGVLEGRRFAPCPSDILAIHSYIAGNSPAAADRVLVRFSQRFDELREFPLLGRDRSELGPSLRGLLIDGYIAFYVVEAERIVIVRVIDGRRDIEREISR